MTTTTTTIQMLYFDCPSCHDRAARTEETDTDIHTGRTYHCATCGGRVIFRALTVEQRVDPPNDRRGCYFCEPEPCAFGPQTRAGSQRGPGPAARGSSYGQPTERRHTT